MWLANHGCNTQHPPNDVPEQTPNSENVSATRTAAASGLELPAVGGESAVPAVESTP